MDDAVRKLTAREIETRRDSLVEEIERLKEQFSQISRRSREIDRELADCRAAARVFGLDISFPPQETGPHSVSILMDRLSAVRRQLSPAIVSEALPPKQVLGAPTVHAEAVVQMPRIKDVTLDRLRAAGDMGQKASEIQGYIVTTYGSGIHEKTVGMTLYRMSQEDPPLVHRKGHTWFFGPPIAETKNPGVDAPGHDNSVSNERSTDDA
jgi:hypothetical protein